MDLAPCCCVCGEPATQYIASRGLMYCNRHAVEILARALNR